MPSPRPPLRLVHSRREAHPTDRELASALSADQGWAAPAAWNKHGPAVFRFLQRALGPGADAEGLAHKVFAQALSRAHRGVDPDSLQGWLLSYAVRQVRSELRRRWLGRMLRRVWLPFVSRRRRRSWDSLRPGENRTVLGRFYRALDRLGVEERAAFVLRHLEGLELREVSEVLGASKQATRRYLARACVLVGTAVREDPVLIELARPALESFERPEDPRGA